MNAIAIFWIDNENFVALCAQAPGLTVSETTRQWAIKYKPDFDPDNYIGLLYVVDEL